MHPSTLRTDVSEATDGEHHIACDPVIPRVFPHIPLCVDDTFYYLQCIVFIYSHIPMKVACRHSPTDMYSTLAIAVYSVR